MARNSDAVDARAAEDELEKALDGIRAGGTSTPTLFSAFSESLFDRKVTLGEIRSAKAREQWVTMLKCHLVPAFGHMDLRTLKRTQVEAWKVEQAKRVAAGEYAPTTVNDWLKLLRVIVNAAVVDLELPANPVLGVKDLDTSTHRTYTREQPNSLTREEVVEWLRLWEEMYPQHLAFVLLGLTTGLRPSSLRPLRREGKNADVLWDRGELLVRRSHTRRKEVMERTKVGKDYVIGLPKGVLDVLQWHVANLPEGPMSESELLFPSETGGFRSASCLDKPFRAVTAAAGLQKKLTPRALRRTFHDLADAAKLEAMDLLGAHRQGTTLGQVYRTQDVEKVREGLGRVYDLTSFRKATEAADAAKAKTA